MSQQFQVGDVILMLPRKGRTSPCYTFEIRDIDTFGYCQKKVLDKFSVKGTLSLEIPITELPRRGTNLTTAPFDVLETLYAKVKQITGKDLPSYPNIGDVPIGEVLIEYDLESPFFRIYRVESVRRNYVKVILLDAYPVVSTPRGFIALDLIERKIRSLSALTLEDRKAIDRAFSKACGPLDWKEYNCFYEDYPVTGHATSTENTSFIKPNVGHHEALGRWRKTLPGTVITTDQSVYYVTGNDASTIQAVDLLTGKTTHIAYSDSFAYTLIPRDSYFLGRVLKACMQAGILENQDLLRITNLVMEMTP